jgi:hypothetical protein
MKAAGDLKVLFEKALFGPEGLTEYQKETFRTSKTGRPLPSAAAS